MKNKIKKIKEILHINNIRKKGIISIPFVIICMIMVILFSTVLTEFQHHLIIRNLENTADLAAEESLRAFIDEESLRNESLNIKEENLPRIRELFLKKIRNHIPSSSYHIERIEIPTMKNGEVVLNENYIDQVFPNSKDAPFIGPHATMKDGKEIRTEYYVGGNSTDTAAMSIVKDMSNLATSGSKPKTSYILTTKVTVIFKSTSLLNNLSLNLLNYVDIFTDKPTRVITKQVNKDTMAVTLQAIGKVTLR